MEKYTLLKNKKYEKLGLDVYLYEHKKTKAKINYIKTDDKNKTFAISFKTPPESSKGISHILEHSVLNGSKKYRTKEPFMDMIASSLQTFLNAMTFPDKTVYPVASENEKDFFNLQDVYLDAVFNPRVLEKEEIFLQEGRNYRFNEDRELEVSGVVYNEMKGAMTNPDTIIVNHINKYLYKDSCYEYISGGNPYDIAKLTYDEFVDYYKRFYHPTNSNIFYYGDMDIDKYLKNLDEEYLSKYEYKKIDVDLSVKENSYDKVIYEDFQSNKEDPNKSYLTYSFLTNESSNIKESLTNGILSIALINSDSSRISQRIYNEIEPEAFYARLGYGSRSSIQITAQGASDKKLDKFIAIIEEELKSYSKEIPKDSLKAAHSLFDFSQRDQINSASKGIEYILMHNLDNEIFETLELIDIINELGDLIETDYYEKFLNKYFLNNKTKLILVAKPKKDYFNKIEEKINLELKNLKKSLDENGIKELKKKEKILEDFQNRPDTKEEKDTIPKLDIEDLDTKVENIPRYIEGKFIHHSYDTAGMIYTSIYFDINHLNLEEIKILSLISDYLGSIDTKSYSYQKLDDIIPINMSGFNLNIVSLKKKDGKITNLLKVDFKTTSDRYESSLNIIMEILENSIFDDKKRLTDLIKQIKASFEMTMYDSGHMLALTRNFAHFDKLSYIKENLSGIGHYYFLKDIENLSNNSFDTFRKKLESVYKKAITKDYILNITSDDKDYELSKNLIDDKFKGFKDKTYNDLEIDFNDKYFKEAIKSDANVNYVSIGARLKENDQKKLNHITFACQILSNPYLHDLIRAKGGAYGAGIMIDKYGNIGAYSYRDPNIEKTIDNYKKIPEILENLNLDQRDFTNQKISKMGSYLKPKSLSEKGSTDFIRYIQEVDIKEIEEKLDDIKNASISDIKALKDDFKYIFDQDNISVFGNRGMIEENKDLFDDIIDIDSYTKT
ncbi:insulinase family protein [Anaerococcus porci]|uniref:Peptidase M16 n=1 Tax=Anaerococcus porci TaxID=2652269 RepID=A0A6N7VGN6_9FIRM|nr:insulinase family protein [Anaerococcus porci]MDY3005554.1 insulinase family protein [Anaerococcus porci]MSS78600.1 peptidase M16 [Anaerococcus porci]